MVRNSMGDQVKEKVDWAAIEERYGDGQHTSIRKIAEEFDVPEATVRSRAAREEWTRDRLRRRLDLLRLDFQIQFDLLEREIAKRVARPIGPRGVRYFPDDDQQWQG